MQESKYCTFTNFYYNGRSGHRTQESSGYEPDSLTTLLNIPSTAHLDYHAVYYPSPTSFTSISVHQYAPIVFSGHCQSSLRRCAHSQFIRKRHEIMGSIGSDPISPALQAGAFTRLAYFPCDSLFPRYRRSCTRNPYGRVNHLAFARGDYRI